MVNFVACSRRLSCSSPAILACRPSICSQVAFNSVLCLSVVFAKAAWLVLTAARTRLAWSCDDLSSPNSSSRACTLLWALCVANCFEVNYHTGQALQEQASHEQSATDLKLTIAAPQEMYTYLQRFLARLQDSTCKVKRQISVSALHSQVWLHAHAQHVWW